MTRIVVGSTNQVKLDAVRDGFGQLFPGEAVQISGLEVDSSVSDQPMTDRETYRGAVARARAVRRHDPGCDMAVGIEGGIEPLGSDLAAFAWVVLLGCTQVGKARSGLFVLPPEVTALVRSGKELGHADDIVFGRSDSKRKNGAVGLLTSDVIDRRSYYAHMVVLGLIPFLQDRHYPPQRPDLLYHLAEQSDYQQCLQDGAYRCESLDTEGFIHCSTREQVAGVADRFYRGGAGMVLLEIEPLLLESPLRYEQAPDVREVFPHVFGPIPSLAVTAAVPLESGPDRRFVFPPGI